MRFVRNFSVPYLFYTFPARTGQRVIKDWVSFHLLFQNLICSSYNLQEWMRLKLTERIMLRFLLLTGQPPTTGATTCGRGCPLPTRKGACPWNPPRRPGTVLSAMTMLQATIMESGLVRAAKLFSKGVFKVINCSTESSLLFILGENVELPEIAA